MSAVETREVPVSVGDNIRPGDYGRWPDSPDTIVITAPFWGKEVKVPGIIFRKVPVESDTQEAASDASDSV